jgi:L-ascorbate metabolism protein UlaG (beta-lactamase superfamily)
MVVTWFGQSAFLLEDGVRVLIDPFGDVRSAAAGRGMTFDYPPIEGVQADLLLITHEHLDHNGADAVVGSPQTIRSTAGTFDTPVGRVLAVASEHDAEAGTLRGPNTIFCFELGGLAVCHLGDLGQSALRPEQRAAIGEVDVLFLPVGGGPTVGGEVSAALVRELRPRLVVPMHYGTPAANFLDPPDAFLDALGAPVERPEGSRVVAEDMLGTREEPVVALLAVPVG